MQTNMKRQETQRLSPYILERQANSDHASKQDETDGQNTTCTKNAIFWKQTSRSASIRQFEY